MNCKCVNIKYIVPTFFLVDRRIVKKTESLVRVANCVQARCNFETLEAMNWEVNERDSTMN